MHYCKLTALNGILCFERAAREDEKQLPSDIKFMVNRSICCSIARVPFKQRGNFVFNTTNFRAISFDAVRMVFPLVFVEILSRNQLNEVLHHSHNCATAASQLGYFITSYNLKPYDFFLLLPLSCSFFLVFLLLRLSY